MATVWLALTLQHDSSITDKDARKQKPQDFAILKLNIQTLFLMEKNHGKDMTKRKTLVDSCIVIKWRQLNIIES